MGRRPSIKWERTSKFHPVHNIISSDFPKYTPYSWKFLEGREDMSLVLSNEYQRLWLQERDLWQRRMYPEVTVEKVDVVKRYVLSFKNYTRPPKPEPKKPFLMKRFQGIKASTTNKRPPGDKAMNFNIPREPTTKEPSLEKK